MKISHQKTNEIFAQRYAITYKLNKYIGRDYFKKLMRLGYYESCDKKGLIKNECVDDFFKLVKEIEGDKTDYEDHTEDCFSIY